MRGRAIAVLLSFLFFVPTAYPACSWTPRVSAQFRSTAYDVAIASDGFGWIADGYGVRLIEPLGSGHAVRGSVAIAGTTRVIAVAGNLAYVGSGSRIHVVRRDGTSLRVLRSVDAGGTVNDAVVVAPYLFVATSNGIAHFHLADPAAPERTGVTISTTRTAVSSLAVFGSTMYAADGDETVEVISLALAALPQKTGIIESLPRSSSVHVTVNNLLLVSDELGQSTDVFTGTTRLARVPYGSNAFAQLGATSWIVASTDRAVRAIETSNFSRVAELFEQQLAPTGGTSNRVHAVARAGNRLYVAAGDIGLVTFDLAPLAPPYPLASYSDGATTTALATADRAFFTDSAGDIDEYSINSNGVSTSLVRSFAAGAGSRLHDVDGVLLSSSGSKAKVWTLTAAQPSAVEITFAAPIESAVLASGHVVAVLSDGTVWRAPAAGGAPQRLDLSNVSLVARAGVAVAFAQFTNDGKTSIRYYGSGDLTAQPRLFTADGIAIGGLALGATHAAVFTFRGLSVVDLATGTVRALPDSQRLIPRRVALAGDDLLVLGDRTLAVWSASRGELRREHPLPAGAVALHAVPALAAVATSEGTMVMRYAAALPAATALLSNRYFEQLAAAEGDLHLLGEGSTDVFWTSNGTVPQWQAAIETPGAIGIAALPEALYVLGANGSVVAYSPAGALLAQTSIGDGGNAQPLRIHAAGNAVWVSLSRGCSSGACQRATVVLDPKTLAVAATLNGAVTDVVTSGTRAYAIFTVPEEIRVYDVGGAVPVQLAAASSPASAAAIGASGGRVYVLADRIHAYTEALVPTGTHLQAASAESARMRIDRNCAVVTGRGTAAELYSLPAWTPAGTIDLPSTVRAIAVQPPRLFLLTDHSVEVWTSAPVPSPARRRSAR